MTIALVLPNLPKYSESFFTNKIKLLHERGYEVIVMVVGAAYQKPKANFPVYYQPILAPKGVQRWLLSWLLISKSILIHPLHSNRLISEAKKLGYSFIGAFRLIAVLSNFLKIKTDWRHSAYGTMAVERALIGKVLCAKVGVSFRCFDICIAPLTTPNLYINVWPYVDKVHSISNDLVVEVKKTRHARTYDYTNYSSGHRCQSVFG